MASLVEVVVPLGPRLSDYEADPRLTYAVRDMCDNGNMLALEMRQLRRQPRMIMVNSTGKGGGVAEVLPSNVQVLRRMGFEAYWLVLTPDDDRKSRFFNLTKRRRGSARASCCPIADVPMAQCTGCCTGTSPRTGRAT